MDLTFKIECFIIKNEKWEEVTKYYYSQKDETDMLGFIKYINEKENINIKLNNEKYDGYDAIASLEDFNDFCKKYISSDKVEYIKVVENEWNNRSIFMETANYYIMRIWETYA